MLPVIGGFTYNQSLTRHFDTTMDRPLAAVLETARYILHGATLPPCSLFSSLLLFLSSLFLALFACAGMYHVRCAEAVFAGAFLPHFLHTFAPFLLPSLLPVAPFCFILLHFAAFFCLPFLLTFPHHFC